MCYTVEEYVTPTNALYSTWHDHVANIVIWTEVDTADLEDMRQDLVNTSTELLIAKADYKSKKSVKVKNKITKLTKEYDKIRKAFLKKET